MGTTDLLLRRLEKELRPTARERIAKGQMPREATSRFSPTRSNTKSGPSRQLYKRFGFTESAITHGNLSVPA
jgi:hypothetical protein